jgi:RNA polymerase sigma-70 factor (sigma-E family)
MTQSADISDFVQAHHQRLVRFGYLLAGDQAAAEDLVQSAMLDTIRRWDRIQRRDSAEAYVRRAMVNRQRATWRRKSSTEHLRAVMPERPTPDRTGQVDDLDLLHRALLQLPSKQRAAVILRFYEDQSEAHTAIVLDCSVGNVKSLTSRGIARLRTLITEGDTHVVR